MSGTRNLGVGAGVGQSYFNDSRTEFSLLPYQDSRPPLSDAVNM